MPTYSFKCSECTVVHHVILGMDEERPTRCPECNGELIRLFTMPNVVYRAGGFQTTDARLEPTADDYDE